MDSFETARLRMRPLDASDEALYCALYTTPGLMRFIATPLSPEAAQRSFLAALRDPSSRPRRWTVSERQGDHKLGMLGLVGHDDHPEIGVMLLAQAHGRGLGTEAMQGLVDHAFNAYRLRSICARQQVVDNPTVIRMMTRLGFGPLPPTAERPEGGDWELHRRDWEASRSQVAVAGAPGSR
jgi:[ribosomal protein S5]-alanine N-acetyltransferase